MTLPREAVGLLLEWYRAHARDLPWRHTRDPYHILVSEIMLQQTRAETVKPYYARFLDQLPTVRDLADADEQTILKLWEGLGYYSRVRNLQRAAQAVVHEHGGIVPSDFNALLSLPGVGRYTAGAVASIAYDIPVPAVDGNVLRVCARLMGCEDDVLLPATKTVIEQAIAPVVPSTGAGDFNQSLIELGATVCLPNTEPRCTDCPVRLLCVAAREGRTTELPVRNARTSRKIEQMTVLVVRARDDEGAVRYAIRQRPARALLGGLYELPHFDGHGEVADVEAYLLSAGLSAHSVRLLPDARHIFTHKEWRMRGYEVEVSDTDRADAPADWLWVTARDVESIYAIPSAFSAYRGLLK